MVSFAGEEVSIQEQGLPPVVYREVLEATRCLKGFKSSGRPFSTRGSFPTIISRDRINQTCVVVVGDKFQRQGNKALKKYPTCVFNELHATYFVFS